MAPVPRIPFTAVLGTGSAAALAGALLALGNGFGLHGWPVAPHGADQGRLELVAPPAAPRARPVPRLDLASVASVPAVSAARTSVVERAATRRAPAPATHRRAPRRTTHPTPVVAAPQTPAAPAPEPVPAPAPAASVPAPAPVATEAGRARGKDPRPKDDTRAARPAAPGRAAKQAAKADGQAAKGPGRSAGPADAPGGHTSGPGKQPATAQPTATAHGSTGPQAPGHAAGPQRQR